VFAIIALLGAKYFSFNLLDPIMGLMGAILIGRWTLILLKDSSKILVDHATPPELSKEIKAIIEADGDSKICDLHLIQISEDKFSCIISIVTSRRYSIEHYKYVLKSIQKLAHITVEINECNTSRGS
jgi:Co/Zn/Cd efflux system component